MRKAACPAQKLVFFYRFMRRWWTGGFVVALLLVASPLSAQDHDHHPEPEDEEGVPGDVSVPQYLNTGKHEMQMLPLGGGWHLMPMGQIYPLVTFGAPFSDDSSLQRTRFYPTQANIMANLEGPGSRVVLRTAINLEGLTIPDGETTYGGWGEGFIDSRHPHTLLHEAVLSVNFWDAGPGAFSISAGKGFATYGVDDPMGRPVQKFPTNHHLSQILERFFIGGIYLVDGWNLEASLFGGDEPDGPYDLSNITPFGNSWAVRVGRRFGEGFGTLAAWEATASYAQVREAHGDETELTELFNLGLRHAARYDFGDLYALAEGSLSRPDEEDGYFSLLGETLLQRGRHQPYYRIEYASRPEYAREGAGGTSEFFHYEHDDHPIGSTRWLINSAGYAYTLGQFPAVFRPFVEVQHHSVMEGRGGIEPEALFGTSSFWSLSAGLRLFFGGDQMRMGTYGILDPMTLGHRDHASADDPHADHHSQH